MGLVERRSFDKLKSKYEMSSFNLTARLFCRVKIKERQNSHHIYLSRHLHTGN